MNVKKHIQYWAENYVLLPIVLLALVSAAFLVNRLTGRENVEDIGAIVGSLIEGVRIGVVICLAAAAQHILYGYRGDCYGPPLKDDIFDACVTSFLLLLFSVLVFGLIR